MRTGVLLIPAFLFLVACKTEKDSAKLFDKISPEHSGIHFINKVEHTEDFNLFSYRNFYNGAGVGLADFNNDGLTDIYMTSNQGQNKLYLNKGDFHFEDITEAAGVGGSKAWSTGVVIVDINNDGWLDLYVCNAGFLPNDDKKNELFISNGLTDKGLTFTEKAAEYNLSEDGYTTHAAFFDYDMDGDLDVYILNNSFMPVNTLNYSKQREMYSEDWPVRDFLKGGGDKLLRNDKGKFVNVTRQAGIYGSLIGFGLGVTVGDVNGDNLPDLYISNDFFERDYLYINQGNGTFKEEIEKWMEHISSFSMGADMADINNDGFPEIFVTDMLPDDDYRLKTTSNFETFSVYELKLQRDFYHQYMHNTLQLNNKDQSFSEISYYSGVAASDWSWGALMFDADNDGYRDLYVCNGIYQDVTDQDFIDFFANDVVQKMALTGKKEELDKVISQMPSTPLLNKAFRNRGDLTFEDIGAKWGFETPSFSNGAAYADLDNDGDLDLVINNVNQEAFLYRNNAQALYKNHYLSVQLKGTEQNTFAIGAIVNVHAGSEKLNFQLIPSRGFQSSVDYKMVFGLGQRTHVDSLVVIWPDHKKTLIIKPPIDTTLQIAYNTANGLALDNPYLLAKSFRGIVSESATNFTPHVEDDYVDFYQEGLTMRMISREGPKAASGDVNGDGLQDIYIGGAGGQAGQLYLQSSSGEFSPFAKETFEKDAAYEDTAVSFFDADGDGDLDLFVGSGGNNKPLGSRLIQDRVYFNDGKGNFTVNERALPINGFNTAVVIPFDFDGDGDLDLFVGSRSVPNQYGIAPENFLYQNDGKGTFENVIKSKAPELAAIGMITDAKLVNLVDDAREELVVVGEWMSPQVFKFSNGKFEKVKTELDQYHGWWYAITSDDVDGDGDLDLILGNRGENFYFSGTEEQPAKLWISDFDENGAEEKIITRWIKGRDMPVPLKKELTDQIVSLKKQNLKHTEYAKKSIQELFSKEILDKAKVLMGAYFKSAVALNDGNGKFTMNPLPAPVQFSSVNAIYCFDINNDNKKDLFLAGNDSGFTPQFSKLDASFGHVLINKGKGQYERMENRESKFFVRGVVRSLTPVTIKGEKYLLATVNNNKPKLFKFNN